jgi:hypothetical protein
MKIRQEDEAGAAARSELLGRQFFCFFFFLSVIGDTYVEAGRAER